MDTRKTAFVAIIVAGLLLVYLVYRPSLSTTASPGTEGAPPALSALPFHEAFVNEEACLACHAQERELPAFDLVAPQIAHEPRKNCVSCHRLPT